MCSMDTLPDICIYICKYSCHNQKSKALLFSQGFGKFPYLVFYILPSLLMPLFTNSVHYIHLMVSDLMMDFFNLWILLLLHKQDSLQVALPGRGALLK